MLRDTVFPKNSSSSHDGMIAAGFLISFFICTYILLYWTADLSLDLHVLNVFRYLIPCLIIGTIIKQNGESINDVGIHKSDLRLSLLIGIPFLIVSVLAFTNYHDLLDFKVINVLTYLILVSTSEEIIFRGYASPRLSKAFGNFGGLLITGVIFGMYYSLMPIIQHELNIIDLFTYIGLGLVAQMILQYLYTRTNNLLLPIMAHFSFSLLLL